MDDEYAYELADKKSTALAKILSTLWERLGMPSDVDSPAGWKMVDGAIKAWAGAYPEEWTELVLGVEQEQADERSVQDAVKAEGGYFSVAYPPRLYKILAALLPNVNFKNKTFVKQFTARYPAFKVTNYKL